MRIILHSIFVADFGDKKVGKEWKLLVLPLSPDTANAVRNSTELYSITEEDFAPYSEVRIQVREEIRKRVLEKGHRECEVTFPFFKSMKRRLNELELFRRYKESLVLMEDSELERELLK